MLVVRDNRNVDEVLTNTERNDVLADPLKGQNKRVPVEKSHVFGM
jgi:hypothetical protein